MDQALPSQWSQFFSQLPLPAEWAELYSRSFAENSMQLEMIPDLPADLMNFLGINKLGHFLMIKKRAKDLLSPHSPPDSLSRYTIQIDGGRQNSYSQLHSPYLQPYPIRNYSLSPPLTNTPPNLVPSLTMDLESINSFHSDPPAHCHVEKRCESFHPIHPPPLTSGSTSHPSDTLTSDRIQPQAPSHSLARPQPSATSQIHSSTPIHPSSTPLTHQSSFTPINECLLTGSHPRNLAPVSDVEFDVQPYTETVFTQPSHRASNRSRSEGEGDRMDQGQSRHARPAVSTQASVQKRRGTNRQKKSVKPPLLGSTTDTLQNRNSHNDYISTTAETLHSMSSFYSVSQDGDSMNNTAETFPIRREVNRADVTDLIKPISSHDISAPGIMFYHSSQGRDRAIVSTRVVSYLVSIPARRDPSTGRSVVSSRRRKPRLRKNPSSLTSAEKRIHSTHTADRNTKLSRTADNRVDREETNTIHNLASGYSVDSTGDSSQEKISENSVAKFKPILALSKLDISGYTLPVRADVTTNDDRAQPSARGGVESPIIEISEGGDDRIPSMLDVEVVSSQTKQSRLDPPSSPAGGDLCPHTPDIEIIMTEIPSSTDLELTDNSTDGADLTQPLHSTAVDVPTPPPGETAGGVRESESGVERDIMIKRKSPRKNKPSRVGMDMRSERERGSHNNTMHTGPDTDRIHLQTDTGEVVDKSSSVHPDSTSHSTRSKMVKNGSIVDSENLQQTDNEDSRDGDNQSGSITIPNPSHEADTRNVDSARVDDEHSRIGINCGSTPKTVLISNGGVGNDLCPNEQSNSNVSDGDELMERKLQLDSTSKRTKKKSRFITTKRRLKLSAVRSDRLMRRRSYKKRSAPNKLTCDEDSVSERVERVSRNKLKPRRKHGSKFKTKSMVRIRPEKKHPSLTVTKCKPIRNDLFEPRGRSTSPEAEGESENENGRKFHRTVPRIPKRFNNTLSAFYPWLGEQESAIRPVPLHNMSYPRPRPGARLSLRDTVVYARQERRSFACFKCTSCFETPYQLLQHSMLERCDQFDTDWPEY